LATQAFTPPPVENNADARLEFPNNRLLIDLCGAFDRNLAQIETAQDVQILRRGNVLDVSGDADAVDRTAKTLSKLYHRLESGKPVESGDIDAAMRLPFNGAAVAVKSTRSKDTPVEQAMEIKTRKKLVEPRTAAQHSYVQDLTGKELIFGIGPAGTGKTYLAVAVAVSKFIAGDVDRIILARPAVEAGERLGFLPGDMKDKVDPYMQPLYDALSDFLPGKQLAKLLDDRLIEIAPLAFMRGRTLSNAFVVLDEAQNTTSMQMKMFLTRLGRGSCMAITGDTTQIDLPRGAVSGLIEAERLLTGIPGIGFSYFTASDVVRHPMVAKIIDAYDKNAKPDD